MQKSWGLKNETKVHHFQLLSSGSLLPISYQEITPA